MSWRVTFSNLSLDHSGSVLTKQEDVVRYNFLRPHYRKKRLLQSVHPFLHLHQMILKIPPGRRSWTEGARQEVDSLGIWTLCFPKVQAQVAGSPVNQVQTNK